MKKTPSALKWLAEKRARVANDTMQTGRMVQELTERHQRLQTQLAALDETIKVYDRTIDPTSIAPVAAWQGRYGKRGVMRGALVEILEQHSPDWVSSELIERALIAKFAIAFVSPAHRKRWHKQSFGSAASAPRQRRHGRAAPRPGGQDRQTRLLAIEATGENHPGRAIAAGPRGRP